jgi:hypothetical protein
VLHGRLKGAGPSSEAEVLSAGFPLIGPPEPSQRSKCTSAADKIPRLHLRPSSITQVGDKRLRDQVREHRGPLLVGVGTVYVGWVASMLATATARLATNWIAIFLVTLPGIVVAGYLAAIATSQPPQRPTLDPGRIYVTNGQGEAVQFVRSALDRVESYVDKAPKWLRDFVAWVSIMALIGVVLGLAFGHFFDGVRVGLLAGGHSSPGRFLLIASAVLLGAFGACSALETEDWRYLLVLISVGALVGSFAVGIRRWVGVYPEAKSVAASVAKQGHVNDRALAAIAHALQSGAPPVANFSSRWSHSRAVSPEEVRADPALWLDAPLLMSGHVIKVDEVRPPRGGSAIRTAHLESTSGAKFVAVLWFVAGDDARCDQIVAVGQLLGATTRDAGEPVLVANEWHCSDAATTEDPAQLGQLNWTGYWTAVRRFPTVRPLPELRDVVLAYRGLSDIFPIVAAAERFDWMEGPSGSTVFVGPFADANAAIRGCQRLQVAAVADSGTCFVLNANKGPTTLTNVVVAA